MSMAVKSGAKLPSGSWAHEVRQVIKRREVRIDFMGIGFDRNPRYSKMGDKDTKKPDDSPRGGPSGFLQKRNQCFVTRRVDVSPPAFKFTK
jgi:hypothetical protein